jgi:hypothetical protein
MAQVKAASRRSMYGRKRPNRVAALLNRGAAALVAAGIGPKRLAGLKVRGRRTGRRLASPVVIAEYHPSMLAQILRPSLQVAPGGRPHVPTNQGAPLEQFDQIAAQYAVFRIRVG